MADSLGPIAIPEPPVIDAFPLWPDYGSGQEWTDRIVAHLTDQPGLRTEQRFYVGDGSRRFRVRKAFLKCREYDNLKAHWEAAQGVYAEFPFTFPRNSTVSETVRARYADPQLSVDHAIGMVTSEVGLALAEVPQTTPTYTVASTAERFAPDTILRPQLQRIIPLVIVQPRGTGATPLYIADRRLNLANSPEGNVLYLPRLKEWSGISQTIGENSDQARFTFGNADGIWWDYLKQVDLTRASVLFSLYFDGPGTLVRLWKGYVQSHSFREDDSLDISASDGVYELTLAYPTRMISRRCWKKFADGVWCPYVGPQTSCPKGWDDCVARGMNRYFGGVVAPAQSVRIRDKDTGNLGYGKSILNSVTVRSDTIYQRPLQEIYTDKAMQVVCDVAGGRDESEFYSAIGIVGEGPIGGFDTDLMKHLLDQQPPHDPAKGGGWRAPPGRDPADATYDFFGISQAPWNQAPPGSTYAAGTAFAEIRRTDAKGLQLSKISDREMTVVITSGIGGWSWTAPGSRVWTSPLTNFVWVAINVYLRALGMKADQSHAGIITAQDMEKHFDVAEAVYWAGIADTVVPVLVGSGTERQFPFRGAFREQKPLRDWLTEIMNTGLGYYTFNVGKFRIGIRINSSVPAGGAFTRANVLRRSVQITPVEPSFNHLTCEFGDEEFDWQLNNTQVYDIDHAEFLGGPNAPKYLPNKMYLVGVSNKSQASRIAATRLREELGGTTRKEQMDARHVSLRTTILGLNIYPGQICSLDHSNLPNGRCEFRVARWQLNPDWSIDIQGTSTCDSMYDLTVGPKPSDVPAEPVPPERFPSPRGMAWLPNEVEAEAGDPLYPQDLRTFALWQSYGIETEGTYSANLNVNGEMLINQFLDVEMCAIRGIHAETSGGQLKGGQTWYFQVAQRDGSADGKYGLPSNIAAVWCPATGNTFKVVLERLIGRATLPGWSLWVGTDPRRLSLQVDQPAQALPATYTFTGPVKRLTSGAPNFYGRRVRVKVKEVEHSGVAGLAVAEVIGTNQIIAGEFVNSTNPWVGKKISVLSDASDLSVPLWNFTITAFDPPTGKLTLDPPCVRGTPEDSVQRNDVMVVRSQPTTWGSDFLTNTLWSNDIGRWQFPEAANGLLPDVEIGLQIRIIAGTGAGQVRTIIRNDNLTHWVDRPFDPPVDGTSVYIVEYPDWVYQAESSVIWCDHGNQNIEIACRVDNLQGQIALVGAFLVDDEETETAEEMAVYREIFVYGQPYEVRTVKDQDEDEWPIDDQTVRIDTDEKDETYTLPPLNTVRGRAMLIINDGSHKATVALQEGEVFFDGSTSILLPAKGDMIRITAAGEKNGINVVSGATWNHWLRRRRHRHNRAGIRGSSRPPHSRKGR